MNGIECVLGILAVVIFVVALAVDLYMNGGSNDV